MVPHHVLDLQIFEDDDLILLRQLVRELVGEVVPLSPRLPPRLRERQPRLLLLAEPLFLRERCRWNDLIRFTDLLRKRGLSTIVPSLRATTFEIPASTPILPAPSRI